MGQPRRYGEAFRDLRARYHAVKGVRPTPEVAQESGVRVLTLHRFEREGFVSGVALHQIATWTQAQERLSHDRASHYER